MFTRKVRPIAPEMERAVESMQPEFFRLLRTLCAIPAPSHHEEQRAAFVRNWFNARGMEAFIDEAKNVIVPFDVKEHEELLVVMAHTDTVFPDMEPMPFAEADGKLYCPGVGDDTANLCAMMLLAAWLHENGWHSSCGVLFVANSCEEGLGNLKGSKAIMRDYAGRVKAFLTLDGDSQTVVNQAVGSTRWRISAKTAGGHSFNRFGNRNAIAVLSQIVTALYAQPVPQGQGSKTTYNVGMISGGTSVNTIAQDAEMLYECRSDNAACIAQMERQLEDIIAANTPDDAQVAVEVVGRRPCAGDVCAADEKVLSEMAADALRLYTCDAPVFHSGSTDCNSAMACGVPSVCFGVYRGAGAHTRGEWIEAASVLPGMMAAAAFLCVWFGRENA